MGHRSRGGLRHHSGEARAAALGDDDPVGPGALGGADDGAQVVGVGNFVADDQQGVLPLVGGGLEDALHADVLPHRRQGDDALVGVGAAHAVQLPLVGLHHHDARRPGLGGDVPQRLVRLPLLEVNFVNVLPRPQGLDDGVASLDDAVSLGGQSVFSLFVHIVTLAVENSVIFCVSIPQRRGTIKHEFTETSSKKPPPSLWLRFLCGILQHKYFQCSLP